MATKTVCDICGDIINGAKHCLIIAKQEPGQSFVNTVNKDDVCHSCNTSIQNHIKMLATRSTEPIKR